MMKHALGIPSDICFLTLLKRVRGLNGTKGTALLVTSLSSQQRVFVLTLSSESLLSKQSF